MYLFIWKCKIIFIHPLTLFNYGCCSIFKGRKDRRSFWKSSFCLLRLLVCTNLRIFFYAHLQICCWEEVSSENLLSNFTTIFLKKGKRKPSVQFHPLMSWSNYPTARINHQVWASTKIKWNYEAARRGRSGRCGKGHMNTTAGPASANSWVGRRRGNK